MVINEKGQVEPLRQLNEKPFNKQETLDFINDPATTQSRAIYIKSDWVIAEYKDYLKTGEYPYLSSVTAFIVKRNGLDISETATQRLQSLVYSAAEIVRREQMAAAGWFFANNDFFEANIGQKIEIRADSVWGEKEVKGKVIKAGSGYALLPGRCTRRGHWLYQGQYVRKAA